MLNREEKLNRWRALFDERKEKDLTIKEFCKEKEISQSQFYYYYDLIYKPEKEQRQKEEKHQSSNIKSIQIVNATPKENIAIRFIMPNSLQCFLPHDMTSQEIKNILELMMSCC